MGTAVARDEADGWRTYRFREARVAPLPLLLWYNKVKEIQYDKNKRV